MLKTIIIANIRYKNSIQTTGEDFRYKVEGSSNLRTWSGMNVVLETTKTVDLGGGMERVTFSTENALRKGGKSFLRVRVYKP